MHGEGQPPQVVRRLRRRPDGRQIMTGTSNGTPTRNEYIRDSSSDSRPRRLLLHGGPLDGRTQVATIRGGGRSFSGDGPWTPAGVYVVTERIEVGDDGQALSIAVPAFA